MPEIFFQLGATLGIALVVSLVMKFLKQPMIIGYIITGIIVGPVVTGLISEKATLEVFSHIGVALLLFIIGLGLKPKVIREVGKIALITGLAQIAFTSVGGFLIGQLIGLSTIISVYLGLVFSLSSTIVIFRLIYNKQEQDTLYGRISIGFLLVQDLVAMVLFLVLSSTASIGSGEWLPVVISLLGKVALAFGALYILMKYITPKVDKIFAENREMLFIFGIGICFIVATAFYKMQFSFELGALAAGVILSVSPYQREIANRLQSLRDFFLIIFFIVLGANIHFSDLQNYLWMIIAFSAFIIIGNPIIMFIVLKLTRYTNRISFLTGLNTAQISEFSLILIAMGIGLGHLPETLLGPATFVGLITIAISSYFISYNHQLFNFFKKPLSKIISNHQAREELDEVKKQYNVILFGGHITGGGLIKVMKKDKVNFLVIDHDPEVIRILTEQKIDCLYGSADEVELLDSLPLKATKLIISTVPDLDVNLFLLSYVKRLKKSLDVLCIANHFSDAKKLYQRGATYVIMPPYLGRRFITDLFKKNKLNVKKYRAEKKKHFGDYQYIEDKIL